ncbi:hypothetical protein D3C85_1585730 [compost metagenome]
MLVQPRALLSFWLASLTDSELRASPAYLQRAVRFYLDLRLLITRLINPKLTANISWEIIRQPLVLRYTHL